MTQRAKTALWALVALYSFGFPRGLFMFFAGEIPLWAILLGGTVDCLLIVWLLLLDDR